MFRRIKILLSIIIVAVIIGVGAGTSFWYFGDKIYKPGVDTQLGIDNIEENYAFGRKDDVDKTYTIYLFPSAIYSQIYVNYLNSTDKENAVLPEEAFGYFEAGFDDEGNFIANVDYSTAKGIDGNKNYYTYVTETRLTNYQLEQSGNKLEKSLIEFNMPRVDTTFDINKIYRDFEGYSYTENGKTLITNNLGIGEPNVPLRSEIISLTNVSANSEQFNRSNKFKYDKFGAWDFLEAYKKQSDNTMKINNDFNDLGRYLPQKLTLSQSVTVDDFSNYTREPITSIGDKERWFNYTFSNWTAFELTDNGFKYPTIENYVTTGEGSSSVSFLWNFLSGDINSYFDIMQNLEKYADSDGVIRLFPYFSNGKNYETGALAHNGQPQNKYEYGGRDGLRLNTRTSTSKNDSIRYFMYDSDTLNKDNDDGVLEYYGINDAAYAVLPNISLTNDLSSFNVEYASNEGDGHYGSGTWSGSWVDLFNDVFLSEYIKNNLLLTYGEGLYNIYVFIGNSANYNENFTYDFYSGKINGNDEEDKDITYHATQNANIWSKLNNKSLVVPAESYLRSLSIKSRERPILVAFERVAEIRLYNNLSDSYGNPTLDQYIEDNYDSAYYFRMYGNQINPYYKNENGEYELIDENIVLKNPYVYIARNVDFTESTTLNFQLRYNGVYNKDIDYDINWFGLTSDNKQYDKIIINPKNGKFNANQVFNQADEYFEHIDLPVGNNATQKAFKLKSKEYMGIYDIIAVYNPSGNNKNTIALFAYRHTINFIKLFKSKDAIKVDTNGLAIHTKDNDGITELSDQLIWRGKYVIGINLTPSSVSDIQFEINGTSALQQFQTCLENYLKEGLKTTDYSKYIVRDYVTSQIVMHYSLNQKMWICNFRILKNYLFYVEKIT